MKKARKKQKKKMKNIKKSRNIGMDEKGRGWRGGEQEKRQEKTDKK